MYNGVHSESEEGHGEGAALFDPRGEHDSVSYKVVYEDVVEVVVGARRVWSERKK